MQDYAGICASRGHSSPGTRHSHNNWSSSENAETKFPYNNAWNQNFDNGNQNNNNKNNTNSVRAVRDFAQEQTGGRGEEQLLLPLVWDPSPGQAAQTIPLEDLFAAYHDCRKHKRNRSGALQFEVDLEHNLVELWEEVNAGTWEPRPSTVFIFLGCFIRPHRTVVCRRTLDNFDAAVHRCNLLAAAARPDAALRAAFIASVNSYLGILRHYKTYRKRRRILNEVVSSFWHKHIVCAPGCRKVIRRKTG